ncbi:phage tail tape measure protein [Stappia sp. F7233]|uniref:Phage tail tape measure protein n=1 Tax=Stappia albiluteola TaxID=2758565 RepID=A0A839ABE8_9HYPH|nr:phage tail tape measure protein [Stappia albiluteola]MBA5776368.1 phage tail tape measure protein [Stappia albiluteola]
MPETEDAPSFPQQALEDFTRGLDLAKISADSISRSLTTGLREAVKNGQRLDAVFRSIALKLSSDILNKTLEPLEKGLNTLISGSVKAVTASFGPSSPPPIPTPKPFAKGGVIASPTFFPLGGGGIGLAGEAEAEAVLPLSRGSDGRLGIAAAGGEGGGMTVVFNIQTPDVEGFSRSRAQIATMVARAVGRGRRGL